MKLNLFSVSEKFADCLQMLEMKYFQLLCVCEVCFGYLHFATCGPVARESCSSCVIVHVSGCKTCRVSSASAPAGIQFLDWTRTSCWSSFPSIPSKASLTHLERLPHNIQHVELWSHCIVSPAACPLPCDLPFLSTWAHAWWFLARESKTQESPCERTFSCVCIWISMPVFICTHMYS